MEPVDGADWRQQEELEQQEYEEQPVDMTEPREKEE